MSHGCLKMGRKSGAHEALICSIHVHTLCTLEIGSTCALSQMGVGPIPWEIQERAGKEFENL